MGRPYLTDSGRTVEILQKYGIRAQKRFGQNFLTDAHVLDQILEAAEIGKEDFVLEIGPGIGTLTQYLADAAGEVCAVEIDKNLLPVLQETLREWPNVTVINEDILKLDLKAVLPGEKKGKVCANLPYYITTPVLMKLLESRLPLASVTVMVQKEVALRMTASPGTKDYGALTLAVAYYTKAELVCQVPPHCFIPRPQVGSAIVHMRIREKPAISVTDEEKLFSLIRTGFGQRRKTLVNTILNSTDFSCSREKVEDSLKKLGLDERIRGEALNLEQFGLLSDLLQKE